MPESSPVDRWETVADAGFVIRLLVKETRRRVVLSRPPEAESWSDIRRNVIFRMRIATVGQSISEDIATYMQEIADDLAAELEQRWVGRLKVSHRGQ